MSERSRTGLKMLCPPRASFKPDAVLLDIVMPNMLGTAIAKLSSASRNCSPLLLLFLTAADNPLLTPNPNPAICPVCPASASRPQ